MLTLRNATADDVPLILRFIRELAEYERLLDACVATEESVRETLFGATRYAEVIIADHDGGPAGFALFFHNYSTFLARPGIYLEDLYVRPELRGHGIAKALLVRLVSLAGGRAQVRAAGVGGADLERVRHPLLPLSRRAPAGRVAVLPGDRGGAGE